MIFENGVFTGVFKNGKVGDQPPSLGRAPSLSLTVAADAEAAVAGAFHQGTLFSSADSPAASALASTHKHRQ